MICKKFVAELTVSLARETFEALVTQLKERRYLDDWDTLTSRIHCGACNNFCVGTERCENGSCVRGENACSDRCASGEVCCDGVCCTRRRCGAGTCEPEIDGGVPDGGTPEKPVGTV